MQFYFIRHGQSTNNELATRNGSHQGRHQDPELTDRGRRQAECLARFLNQPRSVTVSDARDRQNAAGFGITHLYASLMVRAVHTATIVGDVLHLPIVAWEDSTRQIYARRFDGTAWTEIGQGSATGGGISDTGVGCDYVALCVDASGRAIVAWSDHSPGVSQIYVRRLGVRALADSGWQ